MFVLNNLTLYFKMADNWLDSTSNSVSKINFQEYRIPNPGVIDTVIINIHKALYENKLSALKVSPSKLLALKKTVCF